MWLPLPFHQLNSNETNNSWIQNCQWPKTSLCRFRMDLNATKSYCIMLACFRWPWEHPLSFPFRDNHVANYEFSINYPNTGPFCVVVLHDISIFHRFICATVFVCTVRALFSVSFFIHVHLSFKCLLCTFRLTFFVCGAFYSHSRYHLIVEWLSTSANTHTHTTVYHCRKCYLVELLLRLAHKQESDREL